MSRIGDRLRKLHKPAAALGFGFVPTAAPKRQMLLMVHLGETLSEGHLASVLEAADAAVVAPGMEHSLPDGSCVLGAWIGQSASLPGEALSLRFDFLVCDMNGPAQVILAKDRGVLVCIPPDMDASRLRAIGETGADALVLDTDTLDLTRFSAVVECRRVRSASGKSLIVHVREALEIDQLVALWHAGVDGLMVSMDTGADQIAALRTLLNRAPFGQRTSGSESGAAIGVYVGSLGQSDSDEGETDGDDDGDDDEE